MVSSSELPLCYIPIWDANIGYWVGHCSGTILRLNMGSEIECYEWSLIYAKESEREVVDIFVVEMYLVYLPFQANAP